MADVPQFVIQDPYHEYGLQFIDHIHRTYGHQAIVLHTNRRERLLAESRMQPRQIRGVRAAYHVEPGHIDRFIDHLRSHHRVVAVIPFNETSVLPSVSIARGLGLAWAQPAIMERFRNKFALKEHLRRTAPHLRMNASQLVGTVPDVLALRSRDDFGRFILKPNAGYGNRYIGHFGRTTSAAVIAEHLKPLKAGPWVMEEYIDGAEYFVNGQMDAVGGVMIFAVFEYVRVASNGRDNLDFETALLHSGTPRFDQIAQYAERVMRATGLKRSPFHLEVKVDARGPCLVEVAARLAGHGNAILTGELHGRPLNLIAVASHYYLYSDPYRVPLDWASYNAASVRYVHGIAGKRERLYSIEGIAAVEALPQFHRWVKKPLLGMRIERTVDTLSMPWSVIVRTSTEAEAAYAAHRIRELIRWNQRTTLVERLRVSFLIKLARAVSILCCAVRIICDGHDALRWCSARSVR